MLAQPGGGARTSLRACVEGDPPLHDNDDGRGGALRADQLTNSTGRVRPDEDPGSTVEAGTWPGDGPSVIR
jgi:hypothetical protein